MCDVSDGLLADLGHIAVASRGRHRRALAASTCPSRCRPWRPRPVWTRCKFVLTGGEDHALVGTFEPADVPEGWTVIGSVAEGNEERQAGTVTVDGAA